MLNVEAGAKNLIFLLFTKKVIGTQKIRVILQKDRNMRHMRSQVKFCSRKKFLLFRA